MNPLLQRLRRLDDRGATSLEFALVVPLLFAFMFSLIEAYFALFNFQQVQAVASETARCVAIESPKCTSPTNGQTNTTNGQPNTAQTYAVNLAAPEHGLGGLTASEITVTSSSGTECGGQSGMTMVIIAYPLTKALPVNFIPSFMSNYTLTGIGCYPNLSPPT